MRTRPRRPLAYFARCGAVLAVLIEVSACAHGEPPTPAGSPSIALAPSADLVPAAFASAASAASALPSRVDAARSGPNETVARGSLDRTEEGSTKPEPTQTPPTPELPQTRDMPVAGGAPFEGRAALLWQAIVKDAPDVAMPFFFPVGAYQHVKDVGDPAADWSHRLVAAFRHDIHTLHTRLGADAEGATFLSLAVPQDHAKWVEPGEEWNKIGYYRVFGSKLRYEVSGQTHSFDVKSLISWRGEWFVVHLSAIH
jgi:hypothetical protein